MFRQRGAMAVLATLVLTPSCANPEKIIAEQKAELEPRPKEKPDQDPVVVALIQRKVAEEHQVLLGFKSDASSFLSKFKVGRQLTGRAADGLPIELVIVKVFKRAALFEYLPTQGPRLLVKDRIKFDRAQDPVAPNLEDSTGREIRGLIRKSEEGILTVGLRKSGVRWQERWQPKQRLSLYLYTSGAKSQIDAVVLATGEQTITLRVTGDPAPFTVGRRVVLVAAPEKEARRIWVVPPGRHAHPATILLSEQRRSGLDLSLLRRSYRQAPEDGDTTSTNFDFTGVGISADLQWNDWAVPLRISTFSQTQRDTSDASGEVRNVWTRFGALTTIAESYLTGGLGEYVSVEGNAFDYSGLLPYLLLGYRQINWLGYAAMRPPSKLKGTDDDQGDIEVEYHTQVRFHLWLQLMNHFELESIWHYFAGNLEADEPAPLTAADRFGLHMALAKTISHDSSHRVEANLLYNRSIMRDALINTDPGPSPTAGLALSYIYAAKTHPRCRFLLKTCPVFHLGAQAEYIDGQTTRKELDTTIRSNGYGLGFDLQYLF